MEGRARGLRADGVLVVVLAATLPAVPPALEASSRRRVIPRGVPVDMTRGDEMGITSENSSSPVVPLADEVGAVVAMLVAEDLGYRRVLKIDRSVDVLPDHDMLEASVDRIPPGHEARARRRAHLVIWDHIYERIQEPSSNCIRAE